VEISGNVHRDGLALGLSSTPSTFYEWNGKLSKSPGPRMRASNSSFYGHFLELPTGQLLFSDFSTALEVFTPKGTYKAAWQPKSRRYRADHGMEKSYVVKGTQLSGLTNELHRR